jgi:hypothetical protein
MQDYLCTVLWYLTIRGLSVNEIGTFVSREKGPRQIHSLACSRRARTHGAISDFCVGRMTNWDEIKVFFQGLD